MVPRAGRAANLPSAVESRSGVQSVQRAFELLELIVRAGGDIGISEAAAESGLPLPTIHRLLQTLVAAGYVRQLPSRRYALGPRLIPLGDGAQQTVGRLGSLPPRSDRAVDRRDGEHGDARRRHGHLRGAGTLTSPMRMFTEIGRRVALHCTGSARCCCRR